MKAIKNQKPAKSLANQKIPKVETTNKEELKSELKKTAEEIKKVASGIKGI